MLVRDGRPVTQPELAIARAILRTNPRIAQAYALLLATATARSAERNALPPEFLAATLLQESAYDVRGIVGGRCGSVSRSSRRTTAAGMGVGSVRSICVESIGAAALLGSYAAAYRQAYADPYAAALAAYNAGPLAVKGRYTGIPPYPETHELHRVVIFDRWARYRVVRGSGAPDAEAVSRAKEASMTRFFAVSVLCAAMLAATGCGFNSSPADNLTFKPPTGWQGSPGIMGFMQLWKAPNRNDEVLMLFKSPRPIQPSEVSQQCGPEGHEGRENVQHIRICNNQPAELLTAQGTHGQGKDSIVDMVMSKAGGATYMAMYVYPVGGAPDGEATAALRELCTK